MRLHLQNRATHWNDDGTLNLFWCVVTEKGEKLTSWMEHGQAVSELVQIKKYGVRSEIDGQPNLYVGLRCKKCDYNVRYVKNNQCRYCSQKYFRDYYKAKKEKFA
jgi:hypothetical protein